MIKTFRSLAFLLVSAISLPAALAAEKESPVDFDRDIRPILADTCYTCHGPDASKREADLRLDTKASAFAKRDAPTIVPGKPEASELFKRIVSEDEDLRMPPADSGRQLTTKQIALVQRWIQQGADWQRHWAFVAPRQPKLPAVKQKAWPRNDIDHFVLARLEREGLQPMSQASKETLIRRVTLDLTGLPPTLAEIDHFLADKSADAYEKVVDRLLKSPRYGEHMALPWLDAARYSDTNGYQTDGTRAMWPWRDWLIQALNDNMPFDQFTIQQIAGDMLPSATLDQKIASGFNRNHMLNGEGGRIPEESRVEYVVNRLETTGAVWLGLSVGCGRCHDHKYDPLSQSEFYSLYAYYNNIAETGSVDRRSSTAAPTIELPTAEQTRRRGELTKSLAALDKQLKSLDAKAPERKEVQKKRDDTKKQLDALNKSVLITMIMQERPQRRETFILGRGQYDKPGAKVEPGVPSRLHPLPAGAPNNRLGFARWLVDPANPLTARVTVNRFWQIFFGSGLVRTPEDFGTQGQRPTHPLLLDRLATELVRNGWNVKAMHRTIVTSATYRQSSRATPELIKRDPSNRLLAHGPRFRLSSQAIRDQALALSGLLTEKIGGPPVKPYQPDGIWADFSLGKMRYQQDHGPDLYRRSLYTFWRRSVGPTNMFDTSPRQVCTVNVRRNNTPLHALVLLNDSTFVETARALAQRTMQEGGKTPQDRVAWMFRLATARQPSDAESKVLLAGYQRTLAQYQVDAEAAKKILAVGESPRDEKLNAAEHAAFTGLAGVILNLDEVLNKE